MGIPITKILNLVLAEIEKELKEKFNRSLVIVDKTSQRRKSSTLFEYFVLYNAVLALEPDEIEIIMRNRGGPSFKPIIGIKYWKTISKFGEILEPSIKARKGKEEVNFWFDRPFVFKEFGSLRPDILIRKGKFTIKENSYGEDKVILLKNGEIFAECGAGLPPNANTNYYVHTFPNPLGSKPIYFKFKEEFIHPPLIIEAKSFGGVLGNPEEYAQYAKKVVIITPEKIYEPKKENLHIVRLENNKRLSNQDARNKLRLFYGQIKLIRAMSTYSIIQKSQLEGAHWPDAP